MLKPPGSSSRSSGASSTRYASNRRKTIESPTDKIRRIAKKHLSNKKCADCGSKMPQCINISAGGTFICMTCAGIHREINSKIKSLGHSTFSEEEVEMIGQTSNEQVNALWLAKYDPSDERNRQNRQPVGNQDQNHLRNWIKRKYKDKRWYSSSPSEQGGGSVHGGGGSVHGGNRQPQATVAQIPPASAAPPTDLFGAFDAPTPVAAASVSSNFASFNGSQNLAPDPFAQQPPPPQQPQQQQQQNFANFGSNDPFAQQPKPPQQQQPQSQNFANFGGQPQPQPNQAFANFSNQQPPPQQQQEQHQQAGGFANFNQQPSQQQQQIQPPQQPVQQQAGGFGSFNQQPPQQIQPPQQPPQQQAGGFGNFNQQPPQQIQPPQQPMPQQSGGFGSFNQQSPQQLQQQQHQQQPQPPQQPTLQKAGSFGQQPSPQQQEPMMNGRQQQLQPQDAFASMPPTSTLQQGFNGQAAQPSQEQQPPAQTQTPPVLTMVPPKADPMAAFAHLSVDGGSDNANINSNISSNTTENVSAPSLFTNPSASKPDDTANNNNAVVYEAKQIVCYKSNGKRYKAQILKKHLDDVLQPFYTIMLPFGKEKQTDNAHLDPLEPSFEKIEEQLLSFSAEQLQQVQHFLSNNMASSTKSPGSSALSALPGATMQATGNMTINNPAPPPSIASSNPSRPPTMGNANTMASPPAATAPIPDMGGIPAPNITGQATNLAPMMQQPNVQQLQLQPPQMQGQMQGQNPAPQMMMQPQQQQQQLPQIGQFQQQQPQQPMQGQQPPQMQMPGQVGGQSQMMMMQQQPMQGQMGGPPQMMQQQPMQGQPQMMMMPQQQQPMQGQTPPQMGQAQQSAPQGNPFDLY
jgi:hypothetical protein